MANQLQPSGFQAQQYDPTNPTPYQAPALPDPTPAMPSPLPTQMPEVNGAVRKSGAIATVADGILRGFMQGRAYHQAKEVMQLKKKTDDLQNSYNQDAVRLYQLKQAGVDENSDAFKAAKSSVDGSWGALMDFYGQHIEQMGGGKKGKSKKDQQQPPQAVLTNPASTPYEKAQAWYQVSKQAGPPVLGQIAMLDTPEAQQKRANQAAMPGLEAGQIRNQQAQQAAQGTIDNLGPEIAKFQNTPQSQWTDAQKQQYERYKQAYQAVNPPKIAEPKPGDQTKAALDDLVGRIAENKDYKLTDNDKEIFRANKITIDPKSKIHVTSRGEIISEHEDGSYRVLRGPQKAYEPRGEGGGGSSEDKVYRKWDAYYKEHNPNLSAAERDALVRHKVEGAGQEQAGAIAHDATAEPKQFDNDVLTAAIDRVRALPQYKSMATLDDALANIVGQGDNGYQYHSRSDLGKPDKHGKYSGDVTEDQLKTLERDLQTQIRAVMSGSKETAVSPEARRAAASRMQPLFGPAAAPAGRTQTPESPQAGATPGDSASSRSPHGGKSQYAKPGPYVTTLNPQQEQQFQSWVKSTRAPWQDVPFADYDMRGFWLAAQRGDPLAKRAESNHHYPDKWKTPYHKSFSNESQYATPDAPHWEGNVLKDKNGNVVVDESKPPHGEKKQSKGEVWKSDFLKENKGATEEDWNTMKVQLKSQGYEPVDK